MTPLERADLHDKVRAEAMRMIPGVLAAQERGCPHDSATLLRDYHQSAAMLGVSPAMAWSILFTASMHWCSELARRICENEEAEKSDLYLKMAATAASWMSARQGVGGY